MNVSIALGSMRFGVDATWVREKSALAARRLRTA